MSAKGSTTSDEVKAKISASQLARWERIREKMNKADDCDAGHSMKWDWMKHTQIIAPDLSQITLPSQQQAQETDSSDDNICRTALVALLAYLIGFAIGVAWVATL